jgi:hypothetical protein
MLMSQTTHNTGPLTVVLVHGAFADASSWNGVIERLSKSKLDMLDVGHCTWEDGADEYAALVTSWWDGGYATAGSAIAR